ncbi:hypothetical protein KJ865_13305, partial [Myxococcota bacterium]|nr:hypothetical protein [Myxococcota bacterium]
VTDPLVLEATALHEEALEHYLQQNFSTARDIFLAGAQRYPFMKTFSLFAGRCESFLDSPPPENWKGEWIMKTK